MAPLAVLVERRQVLATLLLAGADPEHQSLIGSVASDLCSSEAGPGDCDGTMHFW